MGVLFACLRYVGLIFIAFSVFILVPVIVSVIEGSSPAPFLISFVIAIFIGWLLTTTFSRFGDEIHRKEGLLIVVVSWIGISMLGGLPFMFAETFGPLSFESAVNAFFESISGFTTTGASVLNHIESLPGDILLWRSLIQWLGGMGIILLAVAILPFLGVGGLELYKAEVPGPTKDKLQVHVKETAKTLWKVYVLLTAMCAIALAACGMPVFDSICHSLTTLATGGYSIKNSSLGGYETAAFEWIVVVFMLLAGSSFTLHYQFRKQGLRPYFMDSEFRTYFGLIMLAAAVILIANTATIQPESWHDAIRTVLFQVVSIISSTGFGTADYETWPFFSQAVILFLMFMGGCAGSTAGGVKVVRLALIFKHAINEIYRLIHPQSISVIKFNRQAVVDQTIKGVFGFLTFYMLVFALAVLGLSAFGSDLTTAATAVLTSLSNVGPGFGEVGPSNNYAFLHSGEKMILSFCMLLGRLELITFVTICFPEYWKK